MQIVAQYRLNSLSDLRKAIDSLAKNALHQIADDYVLIEGAPITLQLHLDKLTDGSEVYNIQFRL